MTQNDHARHRPPVGQDLSQAGPPPLSFGQLYPRDDIFAVIDQRDRAEAAVQALRDAGIPDDQIDLLDGAWFVEAAQYVAGHRTLPQRVMSLLAHDEGASIQEYVAEGEQGHSILVVHAEESEMIERVRAILAAFGAGHMRHFGRLSITNL